MHFKFEKKIYLIGFFAVIYILAGFFMRANFADVGTIPTMFIIGWPVLLIAFLMTFPNADE